LRSAISPITVDSWKKRSKPDDLLAHRIGNPLLIGPTRQVGHRAHQTRAAGDIGSNDRGELAFGLLPGRAACSVFQGVSDVRPR